MNINITELSIGLSLTGIFGCAGSLLATYSLDKFNRQLQYAFYTFILGLSNFVIPFCTSLLLYLFLSALQGFVIPYLNIIPSVWVVELFGDKTSKTYLQIMHFFFPIGQIAGSFLTANFLREGSVENSTDLLEFENLKNSTSQNSFFQNLFITAEYSRLWIPYLIIGSLKMLVTTLIITAYLVKVSSLLNNE